MGKNDLAEGTDIEQKTWTRAWVLSFVLFTAIAIALFIVIEFIAVYLYVRAAPWLGVIFTLIANILSSFLIFYIQRKVLGGASSMEYKPDTVGCLFPTYLFVITIAAALSLPVFVRAYYVYNSNIFENTAAFSKETTQGFHYLHLPKYWINSVQQGESRMYLSKSEVGSRTTYYYQYTHLIALQSGDSISKPQLFIARRKTFRKRDIGTDVAFPEATSDSAVYFKKLTNVDYEYLKAARAALGNYELSAADICLLKPIKHIGADQNWYIEKAFSLLGVFMLTIIISVVLSMGMMMDVEAKSERNIVLLVLAGLTISFVYQLIKFIWTYYNFF